MANITFKANLLPSNDLGYSLGSSDKKWNVYGIFKGNADTATALTSSAGSSTVPIYFSSGKPAQCSTTLGVSITGNAATATKIAYPAQLTTDNAIDTFNEGNRFQVTTWNSTSSPGVSNGIIISTGWTGTGFGAQIAIDDDPTWYIALRQRNGDGWKAWKRIPMGDGTGASGTWAISISGSSASCTGNAASATTASSCTGNSYGLLSNNTSQAADACYNANPGLHFWRYNGSSGQAGGDGWIMQWSWNQGSVGGQLYLDDNPTRTMMIRGCSKSSGTTGTEFNDWKRVWVEGNSVTGAVWNDYAECRTATSTEPGYVWVEKGDDTLIKSTKRLQPFAGVSSDTWGFSEGETETAKTHIAVAGRVLVYPYRNRNKYKPGQCVCTAPNGTVDIMHWWEIILFPDRIVGTVSCVPEYEEWGGGEAADRDPVKVNGRIWIKVR